MEAVKEVIDQAAALVKRFEEFRATRYWDVNGWAIGYGTHMENPPVRISREEAEKLMRQHLESLHSRLRREIKGDLKPHQWAAILSWAYNVGVGNALRSKLLRYVKEGKLDLASQQFDRWVYVKGQIQPGLVRRRAIERAVFEGREVHSGD